MMKFNREFVADLARENILEVNFQKKDGTERVMRCTLDTNRMPEKVAQALKEESKERAVNVNVLPVWDVEKEGWRSFTVSSINDVKVIADSV